MRAAGVAVQVRGIRAGLLDRARRHARRTRRSVSAFTADIIRDELSRPTLDEWWDRVLRHGRVELPRSAAEILKEALRDEGFED